MGILVLWLAMAQQTESPRKPTRIHATCALDNHPVDVIDAKTKQTEERDNYSGTCTIKRDGVAVYEKPLALPMYATIHDATTAAEEFIKKTAPKLVKENNW